MGVEVSVCVCEKVNVIIRVHVHACALLFGIEVIKGKLYNIYISVRVYYITGLHEYIFW